MTRIMDPDNYGADGTDDPIATIKTAGGTERARFTEDGSLWIGTNAGACRFQVDLPNGSDTGAYVAQIRNLDSTNGQSSGLAIQAGVGSSDNVFIVKTYDQAEDLFLIRGHGVASICNISGGGKLGINVLDPNATLDVRGDAIFNENGADKDFRVEGDTDANLLFLDASTDKIGIGQSTPTGKLHVKSDGSSVDQLRLENSATGGKVWAISDGIDSTNSQLSIRNQTNSRTVASFYDNGSSLRALRVGNASGTQDTGLGIVVGQDPFIFAQQESGSSMAMLLSPDPSGDAPAATWRAWFKNQASNDQFQGNSIVMSKVSGSNQAYMAFTVYNSTYFQTEVLRLAENLCVGIGTSTPGQKLEVNGNIKIAAGSNVLILGVKSTAGDPTGVDGAMYYNSNTKLLRFYGNAGWRTVLDCN